jgi:hypothetical protein
MSCILMALRFILPFPPIPMRVKLQIAHTGHVAGEEAVEVALLVLMYPFPWYWCYILESSVS